MDLEQRVSALEKENTELKRQLEERQKKHLLGDANDIPLTNTSPSNCD